MKSYLSAYCELCKQELTNSNFCKECQKDYNDRLQKLTLNKFTKLVPINYTKKDNIEHMIYS